MIRVLKWVGIGVGALLLLLVLAAAALPSLVNLERYRGLLANRAGKALGREVALGALKVSLWRGLGAEAQGIQVAQSGGFGTEPFVAADALRVRVQLLPLFKGQVKVSSAILERPRIRITHARDGRWSLEDFFKSPAPAGPPAQPAPEGPRPGKVPLLGGLLLSEVAVRNGEISLLDQSRLTSVTLSLTDLDLRLRQATVSEPIQVQARARIGGAGSGRLETTGQIALGDGPGPVLDATVTLREADVSPWQALFLDAGGGVQLSGPLSAEVKVAGPLPQAAFSGTLNLKGVAIQAGGAFHKPAGEEASLSFQGRRDEPGVQISKLSLLVRGTRVEGSLKIPDLAAPRIAFTATSPKVDLDRLLATPKAPQAWLGPAAAWAASARPGGASPAPPPGLAAQGQIRIGDLRYSGLTWGGVSAELRYRDGLVQLANLRADFMGGTVGGKGEVDLRPKTPRVALTSRLTQVATEPLVKALGLGPWTLKSGLDADASVTFVGFAVPEILGSATGSGSLRLGEGRVVDYRPLERLAEVIGPILASQGVRVRLDEFQAVSGHYTLDKGILRTQDLTLTKAEGTVTATGSLNFLDGSLDFDVEAKLGRTIIEAKVTGTTGKPIVVPKLGRLQRRIETELDKLAPEDRGKGLKDLFRGLFGK